MRHQQLHVFFPSGQNIPASPILLVILIIISIYQCYVQDDFIQPCNIFILLQIFLFSQSWSVLTQVSKSCKSKNFRIRFLICVALSATVPQHNKKKLLQLLILCIVLLFCVTCSVSVRLGDIVLTKKLSSLFYICRFLEDKKYKNKTAMTER